jgi:hypothetical protein
VRVLDLDIITIGSGKGYFINISIELQRGIIRLIDLIKLNG